MGRNIAGSKRGWGWNAAKQRLELYVNGTAVEYFDEPVGRTYYVNNITGDDANDGLSWGNAMDQLDTALLASETYRVSHDTSDMGVRNRIIIQGTMTAYEPSTTDGNCIDIFGIGNRMHLGGAAGDVMVSGGAAADGMVMSQLVTGWDTTVGNGGGIGVNIYNVHFEASGNYFAVDLVDFLLGSFEDCSFMTSGAASYGGLRATEHFAGSLVRHCHAGGDAGEPQDGFTFTGGVFNQNCIEWNWINARRYGFYTTDYLQGGTVVRNNTVYGTTYGLYDNSAETTVRGRAQYVDNRFSSAGTAIQITNVGTSICSANFSNTSGDGKWYTEDTA